MIWTPDVVVRLQECFKAEWLRAVERPDGSFEVFYNDGKSGADQAFCPLEAGWYWQACFPGCVSGGDPQGPYDSEQAAINAAHEE